MYINLEFILECVAAIAGLALWAYKHSIKRPLPAGMRFFVIYIISGTVADVIGGYLKSKAGTVIPQTHVYYLFDFALVMIMFSYWNASTGLKNLLRWVLIPGYTALWFWFKIIGLESMDNANALSIHLACVGIVIMSFPTLACVNTRQILKPMDNPYVLICFFIMLYHFARLVTLSLYYYVYSVTNVQLSGLFYTFSSANILAKAGYAYAFYRYWKNEKKIIPSLRMTPELEQSAERLKRRLKESIEKKGGYHDLES